MPIRYLTRELALWARSTLNVSCLYMYVCLVIRCVLCVYCIVVLYLC